MQTERKTNLFAFPRCSRYCREAERNTFFVFLQTVLLLVNKINRVDVFSRKQQFDDFDHQFLVPGIAYDDLEGRIVQDAGVTALRAKVQ